MVDPQVFALPVAIEEGEAIATLQELLAAVPGSSTGYAERHNNPALTSSPYDLLAAVRADHGAREVHGTSVLVSALVRVVAHQQRRIEELENRLAGKTRPANPTKARKEHK